MLKGKRSTKALAFMVDLKRSSESNLGSASSLPLAIPVIFASAMFVLLKILLHLFRPLIWILLVFLFGLLTKNAKRKRIAYQVAFGMLLFFTNPLVIRALLSAYETKPLQWAPTQTFNTGILLGGLVSYSPSENRGYFNQASDRFIQTALLYKEGHIHNLIVAAGNGYITKNNFREADFIKQHLVQLGIPAEKIYTDGLSRNTEENAVNAKRLSDSAQVGGSYLLISSALHLPRAAKVFRKAGIDATLYPCHFLSRGAGNNFLDDYLLPSSVALDRWDLLIKEWVGTAVYLITGKA
jgi:uncharacterized SAM-binding protein YcdF (DUF218 family)